MSDEVSYVTRGAQLKCSLGSHIRRLNIDKDHGWIIEHEKEDYKHPIAIESDCVENKNVFPFGVCKSASPIITNNSKITLITYDENGKENGTVEGHPCLIELISKEWIDTKKDVYLKENVVTTNSCLVCMHSGIIEVVSSGLEYEGELDK